MMAIAFLGYVLPYGQMSHWGFDTSVLDLLNIKTVPLIVPDTQFLAMIKGLVEGDGYIEIGPQKQYTKKTEIRSANHN
jgi:quinol-cytochrome oxidoreductase complex cytochrome b subunit